jgi:hypothetical protein
VINVLLSNATKATGNIANALEFFKYQNL